MNSSWKLPWGIFQKYTHSVGCLRLSQKENKLTLSLRLEFVVHLDPNTAIKMQYSSSTSKVFLKTDSYSKFKGKMKIGIGVQIFPKSIAMDYEGHIEDRRKGFIYYSGGELGQTHHTDSTFFWKQNMERKKHLSIQCSIFSSCPTSNAMLWKDFPPEAKRYVGKEF